MWVDSRGAHVVVGLGWMEIIMFDFEFSDSDPESRV